MGTGKGGGGSGGVPRLYIVYSKVCQKSNRTAVRSDVVSVSRLVVRI